MRGSARLQPVSEQSPREDLEALLRQLIEQVTAAGNAGYEHIFAAGFEAGQAAERARQHRPPRRAGHQPFILTRVK